MEGLMEMAGYEHVSPELIVNVLGKEYFKVKKKPTQTYKKELTGGQNVYIMDGLFKLLVVR